MECGAEEGWFCGLCESSANVAFRANSVCGSSPHTHAQLSPSSQNIRTTSLHKAQTHPGDGVGVGGPKETREASL